MKFTLQYLCLSLAICMTLISCTVDARIGINWCPPEHFIVDGICYPCSKCPPGLFVSESCKETRDTVCRQDINYLGEELPADSFSSGGLVDEGFLEEQRTSPEPSTKVPFQSGTSGTKTASNPSNRKKVVIVPMPWYINACLIVAVIISFICVLIIAYQVYHHFKSKSLIAEHNNNNTSPRTRLFSRGRLSTTDYMKNLAGLDRQLAMDKILEQRREHYSQHQRHSDGNIYVDDVFVDISHQAAS